METVTGGKKQPPETWMQVADRLRRIRGVESIAFSGWPLLTGNNWTSTVRVPKSAA